MSNLVTYTQAQRLKKLGFAKKTTHYYDSDGFLNESYKADTEDCVYVSDLSYDFNSSIVFYIGKAISAPTVSEALDFIREKGIACAVGLYYSNYKKAITYVGAIIEKDTAFPAFIDQVTDEFDTHPLAESALLDAVLTYLESSKEKSFSES